MRLFIATLVLFGLSKVASADGGKRFPYQAIVQGNDVHARSGPGKNYYATAKLSRGQRVSVHRHDPGGWYMIAPPRGSFSWIRCSHVKQQSPSRGTLTHDNVIVRVGSDFGDDRDIEQVRLSTGDAINILGEKTFNTRFGSVRMFKIAPPRGEYRWVRGRFLTPIGDAARRVNDRDPYSVPSNAVRDLTGPTDLSHPIAAGGPVLVAPGSSQSSRRPVISGGRERDRTQLAALDAKFRQIVEGDTSTWDFSQIEAEYRQLRTRASHPLIARQIDRRLPTIDHYRTVKAEYDRMILLTSQTHQRDKELSGVRHANQLAGDPRFRRAGPSSGGPTPAPAENGGRPTVRHGSPTPGQPQFSPPVPNTSRTPRRRASTGPAFDGAGIVKLVRQVRPGLPRYALASPDGRFLAYLEPVRGLQLARYVGRSIGVYGRRTHRQDLGGDYIVVRAMRPVRLLP
ncbi:MAG: SH3 domain-containing protein [Planctomycetaceae bacterium]